MSDNYEQWSQRFMLSIGENPYASPLWDNANLDEDDISVPVPGNWEILKSEASQVLFLGFFDFLRGLFYA